MPGILAGYDMVVAITQNEINSQFNRMATSPQPTIDTYLAANGLAKGLGGSSYLQNYLRGNVDPPTVQLHDPDAPDSHDHVFFNVTFRTQNVSPADLDALGLDLSGLTHVNGDDGTNGFVCKLENLPTSTSTLANQKIYYWLKQVGQVGTTKSYALVPVLGFETNGQWGLVNLDGLRVRFKVMLSQIPTTPAEVQALVDQGLMDPAVLASLDAGGFTSNVFSLQQLFLNFDTVDFTQWDLQPIDNDAAQVGIIGISSATYATATVSDITKNSLDFIKSFSSALQYAFGMNGENSAGATPYILGINAQSTNPADSDPGQPPSLVPTYIGFGTSNNPTTEGLGTLNYQVLGGANPESRVPKTNDGSVVYVTSTLVTSNTASGAMVFSEDTLFNPFVFAPIQQAVGITSGWSTSGTTMTASVGANGIVEVDEDVAIWGSNKVTMDYRNTCTVSVSGSTVTITGSCYQRQDITITAMGIPSHWWQWCTVSYTQTITVTVNDQNQLMFVAGTMTTSTDGPHQDQNVVGNVLDFASDVLNTLTFGYFDPMNDALDDMANGIKTGLQSKVNAMNANLTGGVSGNFISPTGDVFFLRAPRFDSELNLLLDITYSV